MGSGRQRAIIEAVQPEVDGGRFPIKRTVGEAVSVEADVFTDGHDLVSAVLLYRRASDSDWREVAMEAIGNDRFRAEFTVEELGEYVYTIEAWVDHARTWHRDLLKRIRAGQDSDIDYRIGIKYVPEPVAAIFDSPGTISSKRSVALDESAIGLIGQRLHPTRYERELRVVVDPVKARFSAWYEFFPRSTAAQAGRHGTFEDCREWLPYVARMGFDVIYLPPIHPIGRTHRKGPNNAVSAAEDDAGSPWAIGSEAGGHKSVHPQLGTLEEFRAFVEEARDLGIDVALDIAMQVSPDHPYVREHSEWFRARPDGTIQYAENPPKKYQDIYPFDFECDGWEALWEELRSIFLFWAEQGVRIFRVDNPHTKAFPFWEWAIGSIKQTYPETIFLSEAFTRPKVMYRLAKLGFTQSYTYFPWRNDKHGITTYLTELTRSGVREYFRANQWPNTPDILTEFLQTGGRAAFLIRLVLAATLGASYGIYGPAFEQCINAPREPGSEEYLDSEKYQLRHWDLKAKGSLAEFIGVVNRIRRENPALQSDRSLRFHTIDNEQMICYSKESGDGANLIVVVVNLDPHHRHAGYVELPLEELGLEPGQPYQAHELLTGARYLWRGRRNYVELDPESVPAHIFRIGRRLRTERDFDYYF